MHIYEGSVRCHRRTSGCGAEHVLERGGTSTSAAPLDDNRAADHLCSPTIRRTNQPSPLRTVSVLCPVIDIVLGHLGSDRRRNHLFRLSQRSESLNRHLLGQCLLLRR